MKALVLGIALLLFGSPVWAQDATQITPAPFEYQTTNKQPFLDPTIVTLGEVQSIRRDKQMILAKLILKLIDAEYNVKEFIDGDELTTVQLAPDELEHIIELLIDEYGKLQSPEAHFVPDEHGLVLP